MFWIWQMVIVSAQLWAVCAMTRVARGWRVTGAAFALYAILRFVYDWACLKAGVSPEAALQLRFVVLWPLFTLLIVFLSRDVMGRRIFLALDYGAYTVAFMPLAQAISLWKPSVHGGGGGVICSVIVVAAAHAIFIYMMLPLVPFTTNRSVWRLGSLAAFLMFMLLFICGVWPYPLATGGWRIWSIFALATAIAWAGFPLVYSSIRTRLRSLEVEHNLTLLADEVSLRREAIDSARRQRHDQRHHRIVLAEYLLRGKVDKALAYIEQLDAEANATPTDKLIWCENDTLNAIISGYSRKAKMAGVGFEVTANVERTVAIPDVDLVAVVANLIENAIGAVEKVKVRGEGEGEGEGLKVSIALRQRERTIGMTVTNPVPAGFGLSDEGLPCEEPGVGLESVRRIIARHHGELVYSCENGILTCQAMMCVLEGRG